MPRTSSRSRRSGMATYRVRADRARWSCRHGIAATRKPPRMSGTHATNRDRARSQRTVCTALRRERRIRRIASAITSPTRLRPQTPPCVPYACQSLPCMRMLSASSIARTDISSQNVRWAAAKRPANTPFAGPSKPNLCRDSTQRLSEHRLTGLHPSVEPPRFPRRSRKSSA